MTLNKKQISFVVETLKQFDIDEQKIRDITKIFIEKEDQYTNIAGYARDLYNFMTTCNPQRGLYAQTPERETMGIFMEHNSVKRLLDETVPGEYIFATLGVHNGTTGKELTISLFAADGARSIKRLTNAAGGDISGEEIWQNRVTFGEIDTYFPLHPPLLPL